MSCLDDLPELVGFFSYSREDDEGSDGALSTLRERIQHELRAQLGRPKTAFRLWQDKQAIAAGKLWEAEIKTAVWQSVFFMPIITPTAVKSPYCKFELESFLAREAELGRDDLVFPILYIKIPELENSARQKSDPVLSTIAKRQYVDWREFRHSDVHSKDVKEAVERFCSSICEALRCEWLTPEERKALEEPAALECAEAERRRLEAEARRAEEEARRKAAEEQAPQRAQEARRRREAEAERERAEAERQRAEEWRLRDEADAKRRAEAEERRRQVWRSAASALWPPAWPATLVASLVGAAVLGAIVVPIVLVLAPPTSAPRAPEPVPVAPADILIWEPPPDPTKPRPWPAPPLPTPQQGPILIPPAEPLPTQQSSNAMILPKPVPVSPNITVSTLSPDGERALKPKDTFKECSNCPQMVVVPAGSFTMGSPASEPRNFPQHTVTFSRQFAVGQFELTFDEWDACVADGGCGYEPSDQGWGRGRRPVINVAWQGAKTYVDWLSKKTGKTYRLLTEAEYEYATRAGTQTAYPWGNDIGENNANCNGCGSQWGGKQTAPVGSFAANAFGLYDMVGNVWAWTEDCWHENYNQAPADGSTWTSADCKYRVVRGGSWLDGPGDLRSAVRVGFTTGDRYGGLGFRVGRTLLPP
jgi:formylglycine-generating enzyme required for sulfatase activity